MKSVGAFGHVKDDAPIQWEMLKIWANYQIAQRLAEWHLNPDALAG